MEKKMSFKFSAVHSERLGVFWDRLNLLTRKQLRCIAEDHRIPRGKDKADTIYNIIKHRRRITGRLCVIIKIPIPTLKTSKENLKRQKAVKVLISLPMRDEELEGRLKEFFSKEGFELFEPPRGREYRHDPKKQGILLVMNFKEKEVKNDRNI